MIDLLIQFVLGPLLGALMMKLFGAAAWNRIKRRAIQIIGDPDDPITTPAEAFKKAVLEGFSEKMERDVRELELMQRAGEIEARAALERGRAVGPLPENVTRIEPTGDEPTTQPFKDGR